MFMYELIEENPQWTYGSLIGVSEYSNRESNQLDCSYYQEYLLKNSGVPDRIQTVDVYRAV